MKPDAGILATFEGLRPQLRRFLAARTGNEALADDLLQDMWIKLQETETGPISNPSAYLFKIASNLATDHARSRLQREKREEAWTAGTVTFSGAVARDDSPDAERALVAKDSLARALAAISKMPPRAAEIFKLHRIEGYSHLQIAERLGISRSAVEKNMHTALKYLMKEFSG